MKKKNTEDNNGEKLCHITGRSCNSDSSVKNVNMSHYTWEGWADSASSNNVNQFD